MFCSAQTSYTIRAGDNLYQLARTFQTTVPAILALNPGLDPYSLQVARIISICPGEGFVPQPDTCPCPAKRTALFNAMRNVWYEHIFWTRLLIISIAERLSDERATTARLLRNPADFAAVFSDFYPPEVTNTIARLLTEHLQIGGALITALRDGRTAEAEQLNRRWYLNADQIAEALDGVNPYYDREALRKMLYSHLAITTREVSARLAADYQGDINAAGEAQREAIEMADYFAEGLLKQFPQKF